MISSTIYNFNLSFRQFVSAITPAVFSKPKSKNIVSQPENLKGGKFLIIDNDPFSCFIAGRNIENLQGRVQIAESVHDALLMIKHEDYNAILVDIKLTGLQPETHQQFNNVPLIALTAVKSEEVRLALIRAGIADWIDKDVSPENLLQKLARFIPPQPTDY